MLQTHTMYLKSDDAFLVVPGEGNEYVAGAWLRAGFDINIFFPARTTEAEVRAVAAALNAACRGMMDGPLMPEAVIGEAGI